MEDTCWLKSELFPYLKRVLLKISVQGIMLPETAWLRKFFYDFFSVLTMPKLFLVLQLAAGCGCSGESRRSQQWRLNSLVTLSSIVFQDIWKVNIPGTKPLWPLCSLQSCFSYLLLWQFDLAAKHLYLQLRIFCAPFGLVVPFAFFFYGRGRIN